MIPIIIDTDPGIDDALALIYALANDRFRIEGLTAVFGNVPVDIATSNALWLLEQFGRGDIPVARGAAGPLSGVTPGYAAFVHGEKGFGRFEAPSVGKAHERDAADFLIEASHRLAGELVIVALGPVTNLALAVQRDPGLPDRLKKVIVMGGAFEAPGNVTPAAEANIHNDPEAAAIVATAYGSVDFIGLDVTDRIVLPEADCHRLAAASPAMGGFITEISSYYLDFYENRHGARVSSLHDPATLVALDMPELFDFVEGLMTVGTEGDMKGATRCAPGSSGIRFARSAEFDAVRAEFMEKSARFLQGG